MKGMYGRKGVSGAYKTGGTPGKGNGGPKMKNPLASKDMPKMSAHECQASHKGYAK